ncbi:myosin-2 heavy chain-like [Magallana gigas]|uniref:myosin-2 heavy chain-like n=1 Tax=Magallana gigas TaxID=29159 RepID=UPI0033417BFF
MRSKRMSAAMKAAKAKEKRKAKSKTEKLSSLVGDSLKNPDNPCSFSGTVAKTNGVSGQRLVESSLKKLDTETRTKTRTETRTKTRTETRTKLNNETETRTETRTKLNNETETRTKLNDETETRTETKTKLNNETKRKLNNEIERKLNNETETRIKLDKKTDNRTKLNNETETKMINETETKMSNENETNVNNETEIKLNDEIETRTKLNSETESDRKDTHKPKLNSQTKAKRKVTLLKRIHETGARTVDHNEIKAEEKENEVKYEEILSVSNKRKIPGDKVKNGESSDAVKKRCYSIPTDIQNQIERKLQQLSQPDYGKLEVRLIDVLKQKPKTKKVGDAKKQKEDEVFVIDSEKNEWSFCPLLNATKERLKKRTSSNGVANGLKEQPVSIGKVLKAPSKTRSIIGDGNCFFRALSFAIFGEECHHFKIRSAIVNHLLKNDSTFFSFLRSGYQSVCSYVLKKGMLKNGSWATEVEIIAAAHLLQTDIFVFDDYNESWARFSGKQANGRLNVEPEAIYLKHCYRAHYEVVLSVDVQKENVSKMSASTTLNNVFSKTAVHNVKVDRKIDTFGCSRPRSDDIIVEEAYHFSTVTENRVNERKVLQGNCHQGHPKFGASAGKQCVLNSLASLMYSKVKLTKDWNVNDMNVVLNTGNKLYQLLLNSSTMHNDFVLIAEIPRQIECFNKDFNFEFNDSLYGLINSNNCLHDSGFQTYTVHEALDIALAESDEMGMVEDNLRNYKFLSQEVLELGKAI